MFKQITSKQTWLVLPADDGTRQDTLSSTSMSQKEIEEYTKKGYFNVDYETFNKLLGNRGEMYLIDKEGNVYPKPPYVPALNELKALKFASIKEDYLRELYKIVWVQQGDKLYGYDTDKDSQIDFTMSQRRAEIEGSTLYNVYVDKSNLSVKEFALHTSEMFDNALQTAGNVQVEVYQKYYQLKLLIKNAESEEALNEVLW